MDTLESTLKKIADQIVVLTNAAIDAQASIQALAAGLANQPNVDRKRLAQDVAVMLRMCAMDPDDENSAPGRMMRVLRTPHERSNQLSLGEKLLRVEPPRPDPDQR